MLSFKRFLYLILGVAVLGSFFLISSINRDRSVGAPFQNSAAPEREFMETVQVDEGERPGVWILGDPNDARCGGIYENVRQLCADLRLTVAGEGSLDAHELKESDLVILCDSPAGRYADTEELDGFIAGGGRVILAAGLAEGDADRELWPALGILEKGAGENCRELVFENPLLPVQPEKAMYDGSSDSARIELSEDACVYIRDEETEVPILYTYDWKKGGVCVINGSFLADVRYTGFLTGAISALLPDFVYPVLGVKAVFLDNFLVFTPADDELCRRVYGYSAQGFIRDVVWPAFQGISLRTDTPYTASMLAAASSEALYTGQQLQTKTKFFSGGA